MTTLPFRALLYLAPLRDLTCCATLRALSTSCFNQKPNMPPVVVLDNGGSTIKVNTAHDTQPRYALQLLHMLVHA